MVQAGAGLQRDAQNKVINVRPLIDACTSEGVQLSPQGRGMLCALADRVPIRPPSLQEFMACCNTDGTVITGPPPPPGRGRGRGLGHLCSSHVATTSSVPRTGPAAAAAMTQSQRGLGSSLGGSQRGFGASMQPQQPGGRGRGRR